MANSISNYTRAAPQDNNNNNRARDSEPLCEMQKEIKRNGTLCDLLANTMRIICIA